MAIQGLRGTGSFTADERPQNFREALLMLYPNGSMPLAGLTSKMKSESVDDPQFNWFEKQYAARRFRSADATAWTGGSTAVGSAFNLTLFTASQATEIKLGDILLIEQTGELLRVTADGNGGTGVVACVHGWGLPAGNMGAAYTFDADGVGVNPNVVVVGSAYAEGADTPLSIQYSPSRVYNYTQIFRRSLEHTRTATKTRLRTGDHVKEARRESLEHHGIDIEYAMIFGKPKEDLTGSQPLRSTGGIVHFIQAGAPAGNDYNFGGDVSMEELETQLEYIFRKGAQEKMGICGNGALLAIQQVIRKNTAWQFEGGKEFGMNVSRLICPFGVLVLKTHPLFNVLGGGTTGGTAYVSWASSMLVLDMANIKYRPLKDSDTKYLPNRQGNGIDGMKSEYITEAGFEINHAETHHIWRNMRRGVVDA
jgi:hypothetical protein